MFSEKLTMALNLQINKEFYSGYLYLSMATFFNESGLNGFAHWTKKQAGEEIEHGIKLFNFMTKLNYKINLMQISAPELEFRTTLDTVKEIVTHEKHITEAVRSVTKIAKEENAFTTQNFLEEMLKEQIEEESTAFDIYTKVKLFGESKSALYLLNSELLK